MKKEHQLKNGKMWVWIGKATKLTAEQSIEYRVIMKALHAISFGEFSLVEYRALNKIR